MAHLGSFGRAVADLEDEEQDTFTFYGEVFEVPARLSSLVLMKFAHAAKSAQVEQEQAAIRAEQARARLTRAATDEARTAATADIEAAELASSTAETGATAAMYDFLRASIGDDQWPQFERTAISNGVQQDELMEVAGFIFAAVSGRPTRRPSISVGGPSSTGAGSTDVSGSPGETDGPVMGTVVPLSPAERQMAEFRADMVPTGALLASGG